MYTVFYIVSFILIYVFFALYLRYEIKKNPRKKIWLVASALFAIIFMVLVIADRFEIEKNKGLYTKYYESLYENSSIYNEELSQYQKDLMKREKEILQGLKWNRSNEDVFESNNINIAGEVIQKIILKNIFHNLPIIDSEDSKILEIFDEPIKYIDESFLVFGKCIETEILKNGSIKEALVGKTDEYSILAVYCQVKTCNNDNIDIVHFNPIVNKNLMENTPAVNKKYNNQGVFIGTMNYKGKRILVFISD